MGYPRTGTVTGLRYPLAGHVTGLGHPQRGHKEAGVPSATPREDMQPEAGKGTGTRDWGSPHVNRQMPVKT